MKEISPYWNESCIEKSKELLSSQDPNLWESVFQSYVDRWGTSKVPDKTFRSRRIRIYPTKDQHKILLNWTYDARIVYNTVVSTLQGTESKVDEKELRNMFVTKEGTKITDPKLLLSMERTPKDIRAKACFEACAAHNLSIQKKSMLNPKYKSCSQVLVKDKKQLESLITKIEKKESEVTNLLETKDNLEASRSKHKKRLESLIKKIEKKESEVSKLLETKANLEASIQALESELDFIPKFQAKTSNLKYRRRKDPCYHIFIPKSACKACKIGEDKKPGWDIYPNSLGGIEIGESLKSPDHDFQIRYHRKINTWYIITFDKIPNKKFQAKKNYKTVAIDPGIRTFLTLRDSDGKTEEIGKDWRTDVRIRQRLWKIDNNPKISLQGLRGRERYRSLKAKKSVELHRRKIHNIIDDVHKMVANDLLSRYDVIVLPKLRTKRLLKKEGGLGKINNRNINLIAHGKFHDYITWKASTLGKIVIDQDESYTTQTCYECGALNKIGSSKEYKCEACGHTCDRDIQACSNIMTRYMSSHSKTLGSYSPQ